jgi:tellurite methyltransferase
MASVGRAFLSCKQRLLRCRRYVRSSSLPPLISEVATLIQLALEKTRIGGYHFVVAFNDGPHDLSAHPDFSPTLLPHSFYLQQYAEQEILSQTDSILHETHPNKQIAHFHSLTRILARKEQ